MTDGVQRLAVPSARTLPVCLPTAGGGVGILIKYCALGDRELQVLVMTSEGVDLKKEICFIKSQNVFSF